MGDRLLDTHLEPAWIAVVLRKLLAQTGPWDDGFTLRTITAVDEERQEVGELRFALVSLQLHSQSSRHSNMMLFDVLKEPLVELDTKRVFHPRNGTLPVIFGLELNRQVAGKLDEEIMGSMTV